MDRRLRTAALSRLCGGLTLLALAGIALPAAGQQIEATPLGPPEEDAAALGPPVVALPLDAELPVGMPLLGATVAELGGLDKVTGESRSFEVPVGGEERFGRLQVRVKACYGREPGQPPEAAVFLQIVDPLADEGRVAFSGWMFASSPGLSAMDHARYDVWALHCRTS